MAIGFICDRKGCFANVNGKCEILTSRTQKQPCPFYKTKEQDELEKAMAIVKHRMN